MPVSDEDKNDYLKELFEKGLDGMDDNLVDECLCTAFNGIFKSYNFFDLCRAIFCINSWRGNRSELVFYLSLNKSLIDCKKQGNKRIASYEDFINFFSKIKEHYSLSAQVDAIVPDFGEVKISYDKKFYPVFIGTGHDFIYPLMQILYPIATVLGKKNQIKEILMYVKNMISDLKKYNNYCEESSYGDLYLPTENFFHACKRYYKILEDNDLTEIMKCFVAKEDKVVAKIHFIHYQNKCYPLFNPSIIIDAVEILLNGIEETKLTDVVNISLHYAIKNNFAVDPKEDNFLSYIGILEDITNTDIIENQHINHVLLGKDSVLFLLNERTYTGKSLSNYIAKIKDIHINNNLNIVKRIKGKEGLICFIPTSKKIEIILYDNHIDINKIYFKQPSNEFISVMFLEIIYIIARAEHVDEIWDFFDYIKKDTSKHITLDRYAGIFEMWKQQNKEITHGAEDIKLIAGEINLPEKAMFQKYLNLQSWYPFDYFAEIFSHPDAWIFTEKDDAYYFVFTKAISGYGGYFRKIGTSHLFLVKNLRLIDAAIRNDQNTTMTDVVEDLMIKGFIRYEKVLKENGFYDNQGVHISFMPEKYAQTIDNTGFLSENRKYVFSDSCYNNGTLLIRFAINMEQLKNDLFTSQDRTVECIFLIELLESVSHNSLINFANIKREIEKDFFEKKQIGLYKSEIMHYYSQVNFPFHITDDLYVKVRKEIAFKCREAGIIPSEYTREEATKKIRKIQTLIIPYFENYIKDYDKFDLHKRLLSKLAYYIYNKNKNKLVYKQIQESDNILEAEKENAMAQKLRTREEEKKIISSISYLLESNLETSHTGQKIAYDADINYLIAFSEWLVVLQDNGDTSQWGVGSIIIKIEEDFRVNTIVSEKEKELYREKEKRRYDNVDYLPNDKNTIPEIEKVYNAFFIDTRIRFEYVMSVCRCLSLKIPNVFKNEEILPDVFEISKEQLAEQMGECFENPKNDQWKTDIEKAIEYLTLDTGKLKLTGNTKHDFLPIWEREKRDNRFEVKPIIQTDNNLIFSPVIMNELHDRWIVGLLDFYPPYEIGLKSVCNALDNWKKKYEKQMEIDIKNLFSSKNGFISEKGFCFHKRQKDAKHPNVLGDYDIIAVDKVNKVIWNIESKFLQKVGSVSEYANHRISFYIKGKKGEKFKRRIDYLKDHCQDLLDILEIEDSATAYEIKDFMVTNKVFDTYNEDFHIITYYELKKMLESEYN